MEFILIVEGRGKHDRHSLGRQRVPDWRQPSTMMVFETKTGIKFNRLTSRHACTRPAC